MVPRFGSRGDSGRGTLAAWCPVAVGALFCGELAQPATSRVAPRGDLGAWRDLAARRGPR
eukprot:6340090-Prymnesium_polylepis.1